MSIPPINSVWTRGPESPLVTVRSAPYTYAPHLDMGIKMHVWCEESQFGRISHGAYHLQWFDPKFYRRVS